MSVVPPSPPWATTRDCLAFCDSHRGGDAGRDRRGIAKQRVHPRHLPGGFGVGRGEHFEAAGGVDRDKIAAARSHRRVDGVTRAQRFAAALAGAMAAGQRVGAVAARLHVSLRLVDKAVADGKRALLIEFELLHARLLHARHGLDVIAHQSSRGSGTARRVRVPDVSGYFPPPGPTAGPCRGDEFRARSPFR